MWNRNNFELGKLFWNMLKNFSTFEHPHICLNLGENCLINFRDSNKKQIYGTRNNRKHLMICPFLLKYFNNFVIESWRKETSIWNKKQWKDSYHLSLSELHNFWGTFVWVVLLSLLGQNKKQQSEPRWDKNRAFSNLNIT